MKVDFCHLFNGVACSNMLKLNKTGFFAKFAAQYDGL